MKVHSIHCVITKVSSGQGEETWLLVMASVEKAQILLGSP